ncbi:MAG: class I SAM-dependent methyltransferase [Candidatus Rokubacteria bacterium]|nr:class I SAM-dependent methyltransferase [Candidatus Rokubacteria bacterium]
MTSGCPICKADRARPLLQVLARRMVRCCECGLVYRDPWPAARPPAACPAVGPEDVLREERVGARRTAHFRRFLRQASRPGRLLDVGCGYGFFLRLAREAGWDAVGVDVDPHAAAYATDRLGLRVVTGQLADARFPDGAFDLVTLWNVVECVADPVGLVLEVARVLAPGGRVFVRTQNAAWHVPAFRATRLLGRLGLARGRADHPYVTFVFNRSSFSRTTLRLLLDRAGFGDVRIRNSRPILGDPYLGLRPGPERLLTAAKLAVHGASQAVARVSRHRWLLGPSLEAWGTAPRGPGR